jgi:hypothetical protein
MSLALVKPDQTAEGQVDDHPKKSALLGFNKITLAGFLIAGLGWVAQIGAASLIDVTARSAGSQPLLMHLSNASLTQNLIYSGLALAVIGTLQSGFAGLHGLLNAVIEHTAKQEAQTRISLRNVVSEGRIKGRAYLLYGDGSVEVETLLGRRRFPSLAEAREFVG